MKYILFGIYLCIGAVAVAQVQCNNTLTISVFDKHDSSYLTGATVQLNGENTDETFFVNEVLTVSDICEGAYSIEVYHPFCEPVVEDIFITDDTDLRFELEHHIEELDKIIVQGTESNELDSRRTVKGEIESNTTQTLGDAVESITGANSIKTGNNIVKPMVRGFHSSRLPVLYNAVKQEEMEWGIEHAPRTNLMSLQTIKVLKGSDVLRYSSDGFGGIVKMEPKQILPSDSLSLQTIASMESNGRGGLIGASMQYTTAKDWFANLSGSYKRFGDRQSPEYVLSNTGIKDNSIAVQIGKKLNQNKFSIYYDYNTYDVGILKSAHIGNMQDLVDAIQSPKPFIIDDFTYKIDKPYQKIQHHFIKSDINLPTKKLGNFKFQYAYQNHNRREYDNRIGEVKQTPNLDMLLQTHNANVDWVYDKGNFWRYFSGFNFKYQNNESDPATQVKRLIPDYNQYAFNVYFQVENNPNRYFSWKTSARVSAVNIDTKKYYYKRFWERMGYSTLYNDHIIGEFGNQYLAEFNKKFLTLSVALDLNYKLSKALDIEFNYSYLSRTPNVSELFSEGLHHSAASIELGDVNIKTENAHQFNFDLIGNLGRKFKYSISPYYNYINDYIQQIPIGAQYTIRGAFPVWQYVQQDSQIYGIELDAIYQPLSTLKITSAFAYQKGTEIANDIPLINIPPMEFSGEILYSLDNKYKTQVGLNWKNIFTQTYYPNYNFTIETIQNGVLTENVVDISTPEDAYFLLGFNFESQFKLHRTTLNLSGGIDNIFNTKYRNSLNRLRYYADEIGRNYKLQLTFKF